jgi:hypothetical protein
MNFQGRTDSPLILHCHIPKTAGTTVSAGLRNSFDIFHFHHFHPDPFYILNCEVLEELLEIDPHLRSISSHHLRSFPLSVGSRPTFLMTFLRKPEDVLISQLKHLQSQFASFPDQVRCQWPKDTPHLPLRELVRRYLDMAAAASQDFCSQTRFFCNPDAGAAVGLSDGHGYGLDNYEMTHQILMGFHFVGIVEEMKRSLEVLTDQLLQWGTKVYFKLGIKLNTGGSVAKPAWLTPEDEVGRRVLAASRNDRRLHEHFRQKLFQAHCELRKRKWLGFKPAAADAKDAFAEGWRDGTRSLANSAHLYWSSRVDQSEQSITPPLCSDLLELRAARAVVARRQVAELIH